MSKNTKMTSETLIRVSYYGIFGRNQHSGRLPPPFHFHTCRVEKTKFSTFSRSDPIFLGAQMALPPLFEFLESPKHDLQILYVSFFFKMCCFCSTDPCHKNELAILLCIRIYLCYSCRWNKHLTDISCKSDH